MRHPLMPRRNDEMAAATHGRSGAGPSYLTAKVRRRPSEPMWWLHMNGLLRGRVLDYGCGRGFDYELLRRLNYDVVGYDPHWRNFPPDGLFDTIAAFQAAGLRYYNEAILVTSVGSLPVRAARVFQAGRKIGKTHQNVLVFVKGNPEAAARACGEVEVVMPASEAGLGVE